MRAASYVRMSTEHQRYSVANQADALAVYAESHNLEIVKTYADEGRSGLTVKGRPGLRRLISDVQTRPIGFEVLLVYDVSRWGRFQDADESAFYEFLCRSNGVRVVYCAEPFDNDGSALSTIMKSVKRAMAAEFSRELSNKVFIGQCRVVKLGFRLGGPAGLGLRRQVVDANGVAKAVLQTGERKSVQSDRCILVPGPTEEVATVRRIFRLFLSGSGETVIARRLNREGVPTDSGGEWSNEIVHRILTNEKYAGHNVFNRKSRKLKRPQVCNPPEKWIRADDVYEPLVTPTTFARAQAIIGKRPNARRYTDEELIDALKRLNREAGFISEGLIRGRSDIPSSAAYRRRFGSLFEAFRLAGLKPFRDYGFLGVVTATRAVRSTFVADVVDGFRALDASVDVRTPGNVLLINNRVSVAVLVATWSATRDGHDHWTVRTLRWTQADITLIIRLDADAEGPLDYFVVPKAAAVGDLVNLNRRRVAELDAYRCDNLAALYAEASQTGARAVQPEQDAH